MAPGHVPAWKKIGLKLKSNETNNFSAGKEIAPSSPKNISIEKTQSLSNGKEAEKHARLGSTAKEPELSPAAENFSPRNNSKSEARFTAQDSAPVKKRKSVSFASDTKVTDGVSREDFVRTPPLLSTPQIVASNEEQTDPEVVDAAGPADNIQIDRPAKRRKVKKSKSTLLNASSGVHSTTNSTSAPHAPGVHPRLEYLNQFHTSRSAWKFSKTRQTQLFKSALDIEAIPPSYDEALRDYMASLQGQQASKRLRAQAQEVIDSDDAELAKSPPSEDQAGLDSKEKPRKKRKTDAPTPEPDTSMDAFRRSQYKQALARAKEKIQIGELAREEHELVQDPAWRKRWYLRRRAEMLIWSTGTQDWNGKDKNLHPTPGKVEIVEEVGGKGQVKRRRKRKRRSGIPDDDTSSSESSRNDSSDSDSGESLKAVEQALRSALGGGTVAIDAANGVAENEKDETSSSEASGSEDTSSDGSDD